MIKDRDRLVSIASTAVATVAAASATTATAATTVAATASTATTTVAATASAAAAIATTTAAATAFFTWACFVDGQGAAVVFLAIERFNRRLGLFIAAHLDETKALAAARFTVVDDLGGRHRPMSPKQLFQLGTVHTVRQIPYIQLLTHEDLLNDG
jgi:hypothetical protein